MIQGTPTCTDCTQLLPYFFGGPRARRDQDRKEKRKRNPWSLALVGLFSLAFPSWPSLVGNFILWTYRKVHWTGSGLRFERGTELPNLWLTPITRINWKSKGSPGALSSVTLRNGNRTTLCTLTIASTHFPSFLAP